MVTSYSQYLSEVNKNLNFFEGLTDKATGIDERLDLIAKILIQQTKILGVGIVPGLVIKPEVPPYSIRKFDLGEAQESVEVKLNGDSLVFYSDGTLNGIEFALDSPTNDWVEATKFNPYYYPAHFETFYLKWDSQPGKTLTVHIGRERGSSALAQKQLVDLFQQSTGIYLQPEWASKEGNDKSFQAGPTLVSFGGGCSNYYVIPTGKVFYLNYISGSSRAKVAGDGDNPQICAGIAAWRPYSGGALTNLVEIGGNGGWSLNISPPLVYEEGEVADVFNYNYANHDCYVSVSFGGFEVDA